MPQLKHSVPRYRKHKASGQAIVTLNGQDHYLGPHGSRVSKREYDRRIGEWLATDRQPLVGEADSLTTIEAIARYWQHVRRHYVKNGKPTSEQHGIRSALRFVKNLYGHTPAAEFSPLAIRAVRQQMVDANLARSTINQNISRIRRLFKWLAAEQLVSVTVYQTLAVVDGFRKGRGDARETKPVLPIDDAIVEATLLHLPDVVADLVRFQRATGCRPAEVCALRPCDVDRSGDVWRYVPGSHKTEHHGTERAIFVGPKAQGVLMGYLARDPQTHCFRPVDSEAKRRAAQHESRVVPISRGTKPGDRRKRNRRREPGGRYTTDSYRRAIQRACKKAGLDAWTPHRLRHTAGTEIRRQFGVEASRVCLGHAKVNTTELYSERDQGLAARVAREVG